MRAKQQPENLYHSTCGLSLWVKAGNMKINYIMYNWKPIFGECAIFFLPALIMVHYQITSTYESRFYFHVESTYINSDLQWRQLATQLPLFISPYELENNKIFPYMLHLQVLTESLSISLFQFFSSFLSSVMPSTMVIKGHTSLMTHFKSLISSTFH